MSSLNNDHRLMQVAPGSRNRATSRLALCCVSLHRAIKSFCAIYFTNYGIICPIYTYSSGTGAKCTVDRHRSCICPTLLASDASTASRPPMPFHHEDSPLWPYLRAPLHDRGDIVKLNFADTSALNDVDAFERKNGAKLSKKDRAREREEIERSWDVAWS